MPAKRVLGTVAMAAAILGGLWAALVRGGDEPEEDGTPPSVAEVGATIEPAGRDADLGSVVHAAGSVWVTQRARGGDSVFRIDPDTSDLVARIPIGRLGSAPGWTIGGGGIAEGAGSIWLVGNPGGEGALLLRIDPETDEVVTRVPLDARFGGDLAATEAAVWVSADDGTAGAWLFRVDTDTEQVVAKIPIEGGWVREVFAFDGAVVVRSRTEAGNRLTVVDPATDEVAVSPLIERRSGFDFRDPLQDYALGAGEDSVWIGGGADSIELARVDPRTGRRRGSPLEVERPLGGHLPLVEGLGCVWFVGHGGRSGRATLNCLDPETGAVEITVELPRRRDPIALAAGPDAIWVLALGGSLTRVDLR